MKGNRNVTQVSFGSKKKKICADVFRGAKNMVELIRGALSPSKVNGLGDTSPALRAPSPQGEGKDVWMRAPSPQGEGKDVWMRVHSLQGEGKDGFPCLQAPGHSLMSFMGIILLSEISCLTIQFHRSRKKRDRELPFFCWWYNRRKEKLMIDEKTGRLENL